MLAQTKSHIDNMNNLGFLTNFYNVKFFDFWPIPQNNGFVSVWDFETPKQSHKNKFLKTNPGVEPWGWGWGGGGWVWVWGGYSVRNQHANEKM